MGIEENEQKINHHGKGADAIVTGRLQHSRSSSSPELSAITKELFITGLTKRFPDKTKAEIKKNYLRLAKYSAEIINKSIGSFKLKPD